MLFKRKGENIKIPGLKVEIAGLWNLVTVAY